MQEEQEEMIKTGKPEKRRPSDFKNGVIIGLVLGLLIRESVPESEFVRMRILQTIMLYLDHRE